MVSVIELARRMAEQWREDTDVRRLAHALVDIRIQVYGWHRLKTKACAMRMLSEIERILNQRSSE